MHSRTDRRAGIIIPCPSLSAPKLKLSPRERAFEKVLTTERLAAAAPVLWHDLLERCRSINRPPTARREWLEFRQRAIIKRVACSGTGLTAVELARSLRAITAAHGLRDDMLEGIEALCELRDRKSCPAQRRQIEKRFDP